MQVRVYRGSVPYNEREHVVPQPFQCCNFNPALIQVLLSSFYPKNVIGVVLQGVTT